MTIKMFALAKNYIDCIAVNIYLYKPSFVFWFLHTLYQVFIHSPMQIWIRIFIEAASFLEFVSRIRFLLIF